MEESIYLLIGGNTGDREFYMQEARRAIEQSCGSVLKESALYETAAWGKEDQPPFLNKALKLASPLLPLELLASTAAIEAALGRQRTEQWGARTMDIDLIFYGTQVLNTASLVLPHPAMQLRRFVLAPLAEIAPEFEHPVLKVTVAHLLEICADKLPAVRLPR